MAQINNHIQKGIENYIRRKYDNLADEYSEKINEDLGLLETLLERKNLNEYIERVEIMFVENREELIERIIDLTDLMNRAYNIYHTLEGGDGIISKLEGYVKEFEEKIDKPFTKDEILTMARLVADFKQIIAGQVIEYKIFDLKDLESRRDTISQSINWKEIREKYHNLADSWRKKIEEVVKTYHNELKRLKKHFVEVLGTTASWVVEEVPRFNIPVNNIFQEFVDTLKKISDITISLEVVVPDYDYDLMFSQYIQAKEERNKEALLTIYLTVESNIPPDVYDWTIDKLIEELDNNYF